MKTRQSDIRAEPTGRSQQGGPGGGALVPGRWRAGLGKASSVSSFRDSMVDWLEILLLPNMDLEHQTSEGVFTRGQRGHVETQRKTRQGASSSSSVELISSAPSSSSSSGLGPAADPDFLSPAPSRSFWGSRGVRASWEMSSLQGSPPIGRAWITSDLTDSVFIHIDGTSYFIH